MKIYLLFDCPDDANDKKWLEQYLIDQFGNAVQTIPISHVLSELHKKGIIGKIKVYFTLLIQSVHALGKSKSGDVIICWWRLSGLITNALSLILGNTRYIISLNWLSPLDSDKKLKRLINKAFSNDKCQMTCNTLSSVVKWEKWIGYSLNGKFTVIPDVYDEQEEFVESVFKSQKYCFTGGMNNRDWKFLNSVAMKMKNVTFVAVANKKDYEANVESTEPNVEVYYDISPEEYYSLMKNASIILLPLRDEKVAGLINILKSAQLGIPCIVTETDATSQYYSNRDLLIDKEVDKWCACIARLLSDEKYYLETTVQFQNNIKVEFSPYRAAKSVINMISAMRMET